MLIARRRRRRHRRRRRRHRRRHRHREQQPVKCCLVIVRYQGPNFLFQKHSCLRSKSSSGLPDLCRLNCCATHHLNALPIKSSLFRSGVHLSPTCKRQLIH